VTVTVEAPDPGPTVEAQRDRILRASLNLAVNGLESAGESGHVGLVVRRDGKSAVITISDTGAGVGPEIAGRIFELHFTTKATGTGLGLYVARSAFEADGGSVELAESPAVGATFEARLPLAAEDTPACPES
jgi:signal transduction histidine kinase